MAVAYFFLGGIAGGTYALAALARLFGGPEHRPVAVAAGKVALPAVVLGAAVLVVDLRRPERFWHMLFQSERAPTPMFKWWSPMSVGAWALALFGAFAVLAFLESMAREGRLRARWPVAIGDGVLGKAAAVVGGLFGFFLAAYTGVLLSVTNRPLWSETTMLGLVFVISSAATSAALLDVMLRRKEGTEAARAWLARVEVPLLLAEAVALALLVASLAGSLSLVAAPWAAVFALGVVGVGIVVPLLFRGGPRAAWAPACVLLGGLLLRTIVVYATETL
jgi:formate-dependent nitrite reductase membrane component NrfD